MKDGQFDNRRRRYVPLDVMVAFEDFGTKLLDRWGMEGLCAWMLFLAACKREMNQGTFTYSSEEEGWAKLGAKASGFTLDDFFKWTGTQKKTSKKRSGRVRYISCSVWEKWNTMHVSQQNPRSQPQNTETIRDESEEMPEDRQELSAPDSDSEVEGETEVQNRGNGAAQIDERVLRLLDVCRDADRSTGNVLRKYLPGLREADVGAAIEAARGPGVKSPTKVCVAILKQRAEARTT